MDKLRLTCSAFAIAVASLASSASIAQTVTLKIATFTPPRAAMAVDIMDPWVAKMEAESDGELKFEKYYGGTLGRDPGQQLKLVQDGVSDIAHVVPHYTIGRFPDDDLFNLPNLFTNATEASIAYWRLYERKLMRGFEDVQALGTFTTGTNGIHTKAPIKGLADVKGLKLRTSGEGMTEAARLLGAVGVPVAATAMAENISRGLIDGVMLDWVAIDLFRVQEVTPYHLDINIGVIPNLLAVNPKAFEKLSPKAKEAVRKHGGATFARVTGKYNDDAEVANRAKLRASGKHTIIKLSAAEDAQIKKLLQPMHDQWKKGRPNGDKLYAELEKILADLRAGK